MWRFDKAMFNCQNMTKRMMDFSDSSKWTQSAQADEYKQLVNSGKADAIQTDNDSQKLTGNNGKIGLVVNDVVVKGSLLFAQRMIWPLRVIT